MKNNQETVTVEMQIPTRIYLHGRRPLEETKEIAAEHLRNQANSIFDFIAYGSELAQNGDFDEKIYLDLCGVLGKLGGNLMEAVELVEIDHGKHLLNASLPVIEDVVSPTEETFTEHLVKRMADRLATVLENPDVPESAKDALSAIAENVLNIGTTENKHILARQRFAETLLSLGERYAHAALDSLTAVMENCIPEELYLPIHEANMEKFK